MSENNVIISIKGVQTNPEQEEETIELVTEGRLESDGEAGYTLSYQESEVTGLEGTLTTFQIEKDRITLLRLGEFNSQMVFEQGRRHLSMYNTPYGALSVGVNTREMEAHMGERGGKIRIAYDVEIDHAVTGMNTFEIQVREAKRDSASQILNR
ncbi:hypothetical protein B5G43_06645 [Flavonifractor sp. An92]|uniref:DUF1934 domain-containing protein n=1 Tax=Flavonifractor sp. An92 TaxID=1965666 RepID=UPI000B3842D9|nr:DUF1934 domain-containing protein [Flavonifractor sp. An92]OUN06978.1 hypothetical protein B5G43_06645 [Flavonifractor sp. An92]